MVATTLSTFSAEDMMNGNFQERRPLSPSPITSSSMNDQEHSSQQSSRQQSQQSQQQQNNSASNNDALVPYSAMDVLCGTNNYNHPGNRRFRSIIDANLQRYVDAPARADKTKVVCAVLQEIVSTAPCRFLKQDPKTKQWHELDKQASKTKVGHALRVKSRFLPKSKDMGVGAMHHPHLHPHPHHHHHHPHSMHMAANYMQQQHSASSSSNNNNTGNNNTNNGMGGYPTTAGDLKNSRLLNMFLHDDGLKKPMHPQQYQYQYTTENAKLMMSHELQGLLGGMQQSNHQQQQQQNAGFFFNNTSGGSNAGMNLPLSGGNMMGMPNNNSNQDGAVDLVADDDDEDDMASNASSDDSDFLERINELPLSHFGALDIIGGAADEEEEDDEDDMMPMDAEEDFDHNVRGEELIQMLDFATAL